MLSGWLHLVISNAYVHMGRDLPFKSNPHTIRKVSSSWKEYSGASARQIVRSGTWTSLQTFATFYRLDFASASATADCSMLRKVMGRSSQQT
jgi:hypothetical protein